MPNTFLHRLAFSDEEDTDDVEMELQQQLEEQQKNKPARTAARKQAPSYNDADMGEDEDEGDEDEGDANGAAPAAVTGDLDEEDEEGEDDGEVFVVEKIMSHMIDKQGQPLFEVKWEGWEKKSDRTWEPEENLIENASEVLNEYLETIGGRAKLFEDSAKALKTKKRSRASSSTPQAASSGSGKRSRKNNGYQDDSEPPLSAKAVTWKPPPGSWEEHVAHLDACEDEESGSLVVYLTWKNGKKTQHSTQVVYQRCPQKMLQFYERHVRIIKRDPEPEDVDADTL